MGIVEVWAHEVGFYPPYATTAARPALMMTVVYACALRDPTAGIYEWGQQSYLSAFST